MLEYILAFMILHISSIYSMNCVIFDGIYYTLCRGVLASVICSKTRADRSLWAV